MERIGRRDEHPLRKRRSGANRSNGTGACDQQESQFECYQSIGKRAAKGSMGAREVGISKPL